jgi:hypothetical protein
MKDIDFFPSLGKGLTEISLNTIYIMIQRGRHSQISVGLQFFVLSLKALIIITCGRSALQKY